MSTQSDALASIEGYFQWQEEADKRLEALQAGSDSNMERLLALQLITRGLTDAVFDEYYRRKMGGYIWNLSLCCFVLVIGIFDLLLAGIYRPQLFPDFWVLMALSCVLGALFGFTLRGIARLKETRRGVRLEHEQRHLP